MSKVESRREKENRKKWLVFGFDMMVLRMMKGKERRSGDHLIGSAGSLE